MVRGDRLEWAAMHVRVTVALAVVALSMSFVSAQQPAPAEKPKAANSAAQRVSRDIRVTIQGVALDGDRKPLGNSRLRLRNLDVNEVERTTTSTLKGEFSFVARAEIPYVVEIADGSGRVLAVSDVISARAGEAARTMVVLPSRLPAASGIFVETAASVIAAATSIGVTVLDPARPKVSPTR